MPQRIDGFGSGDDDIDICTESLPLVEERRRPAPLPPRMMSRLLLKPVTKGFVVATNIAVVA
jgi:hypothetical protein